ncbi:MAG: methylmalonyl-CoA epimerase [Candidatus Kapaibacteriota bacterium]|jgi:methylmalonyl-CoA/ethylmalonyl-CoA epimerase
MISGINHIGIAVKDLEVSKELYSKIFNVYSFHNEEVFEQKVKVASFSVGDVLIELTQATSPDSPIAKYIDKRGEGIHHIAFTTQGINEELTKLSLAGIELINKQAVDGAHNMNIGFLHPKSTGGVLMELCESKK